MTQHDDKTAIITAYERLRSNGLELEFTLEEMLLLARGVQFGSQYRGILYTTERPITANTSEQFKATNTTYYVDAVKRSLIQHLRLSDVLTIARMTLDTKKALAQRVQYGMFLSSKHGKHRDFLSRSFLPEPKENYDDASSAPYLFGGVYLTQGEMIAVERALHALPSNQRQPRTLRKNIEGIAMEALRQRRSGASPPQSL